MTSTKDNAIDWDGEKKISLALQGGGAHGAFTWGVLDAILEDKRLDIEAISGCSAGAMNAVVLAEGYLENGRKGAREKLHRFWHSVSDDGTISGSLREVFEQVFSGAAYEDSPLYLFADLLTHYASPYQFNPLDINPLRDHLVKMIDFKKVRSCSHMKLFISATNVETGKIAIFHGEEMTVHHLLASACLPYLFQAVEIGGVPYWDGGYMGNPALYPLFYQASSQDILLVQVNPVERRGVPKTARDIQDRINEITFNGALLREFRAIEFVNRLIDEGKLAEEDYRRSFVHRIDGGKALAKYSAATKLNSSWPFLQELRDLGRDAAKAFLAAHYADLGQRGTLDLRDAFSGGIMQRTVPAMPTRAKKRA
ncbi:MAG: patatin-like phospholipase family protein [Hyphomicrobiales bacterium]|nr:patatin-like phospholipase family protein [Hyphomicrobiales bacterium]